MAPWEVGWIEDKRKAKEEQSGPEVRILSEVEEQVQKEQRNEKTPKDGKAQV